MKIKYITTRTLKNEKGETKGKIRVLVLQGQSNATVNYTCPRCSFSEKTTKEWKRPFSVKCKQCGFLIRVPRLKRK